MWQYRRIGHTKLLQALQEGSTLVLDNMYMLPILLFGLFINLTICFSPIPRIWKHQHHHELMSTATIGHQDEETTHQEDQSLLHKCQGCNTIFNSRNALFRHLHGEDEASIGCSLVASADQEELQMACVIRYGYKSNDNDGGIEGDAMNESVANIICNDAFSPGTTAGTTSSLLLLPPLLFSNKL